MTRPPSPEICIFCPRKATTGEHLFSDWLKALFPHASSPHYTRVRQKYETRDGTVVPLSELKSRHKRPLNTLRHFVVCDRCNNGWMSRMETRTKPLLVALIKRRQKTFDRRQIKILAQWIAKLTIVAEFGDITSISIPERDRALVKRNAKLPSEWHIWVGSSAHDGDGLGITTHTVSVYSGAVDLTTLRKNTNSTIILMGSLVVFVARSSVLEIKFDERNPIAGKMRKIRPNPDAFQWPPEQRLSDAEVFALIGALAGAVGGPRPGMMRPQKT